MVTQKDFPILSDFPPVKTCKKFTGKESFDAVHAAEAHAVKQGFKYGSMCRDEPIALAKNVDYIAKWYNIERADWPRIEGMLLSKDFRDGEVYMVTF